MPLCEPGATRPAATGDYAALLDMLAGKLVMEKDKAERWVVDLIRGALLDAKIDSGANTVVMGSAQASVYDQVVDKTRDLSQRTAALLGALETKVCVEV